ncbi:gamma-glutamyltransferase family protein [Halovivax limisalsi]|uniref:gamma-glutamyltransferase family protein n=1 Tax=Halovivax limisalsi TaxID=1453760 RepID=UPI001FFD1AE5|nr:gamma-glutamyltransferase family protein [Halovivax limisalsi]
MPSDTARHGDAARQDEADDETADRSSNPATDDGGTDRETDGEPGPTGPTRRDAVRGSMAVLGASAIPASVSAAPGTSECDDDSPAAGPAACETSEAGMVTTSHAAATDVGVTVLERGGNAVDAAVAVQFALNVVQPHASGIGGGGFVLVYDAERDDVTCIDGRERAPLGAEPDMFLDEDGDVVPFLERHTNGKAVGVPGTLRACDVALKRFGTKPLAELIQPAIELAGPERPVTVDAHLAESIAENVDDGSLSKTAMTVFAPGGDPLEEGDLLVQPDLAETFSIIRDEGIEPFYRGEIADDIATTVQEADRYREEGGSMTVEDLGNYAVETPVPTHVTYEGSAAEITVRTMPSPTSGGYAIGQILSILEPFELDSFDRRSFETYHHLAQAFKLAFADRGAYLGDVEFVDIPWQGLLDETYIDERRALIDPEEVSDAVLEPGDPFDHQPGDRYAVTPREDCPGGPPWGPPGAGSPPESPGPKNDTGPAGSIPIDGHTDHFTIADAEGNVVSWTSTIEQFFGSGIMVPGRGFMLNNELTDFDEIPGGPNEVQPEKRPLSSMSPTIAFRDGEPFLALGSPGGFAIIVAVAQVILNVAEFGLSLEEAVAEPRIYTATGDWLQVEPGVPDAAVEALADAGHGVSETEAIGNVQAVLSDDGYVGVADERRDGEAGSPSGAAD